MAYVPDEDLKRMSRMLMNHAEMIANNYCFVNKHDEPDDEADVTSKLLRFFGQKIIEVEYEGGSKFDHREAVRYLRARGLSDEQILSIWEAFSRPGAAI